jgi:D-alanyl-D-alanine dipeptidase
VATHRERVLQVQKALLKQDLDYMFLTISPGLFYLTGYSSLISERLYLLVIPSEGRPTMIFPDYEKTAVDYLADWIEIVGWLETEDPISFVRNALAPKDRNARIHIAISDHTHAIFLLRMQEALPKARFILASEILSPMRRVKDREELRILKEAQDMAVESLKQLFELPFAGRTEKQIAADLHRICESAGLKPEYMQVGSGPNSAQFDPNPTGRVIQRGEPVVIDFGGIHNGYYSDCTRTVHVGPPSDEFKKIFSIVREANHAAFAAIRPNVSCESIDRTARQVIAAAGYGEYFLHRLGHGIGIEIHEEPWMVEGNKLLLESGMTFTDEPGIYLPGKFGCRLEDVIAVTESGGLSLTDYSHDIIVVE